MTQIWSELVRTTRSGLLTQNLEDSYRSQLSSLDNNVSQACFLILKVKDWTILKWLLLMLKRLCSVHVLQTCHTLQRLKPFILGMF